MKRILVIGSGGAGKSRFSTQLGRKLSIQVHHLDRYYWKPGWQPTDREEFIPLLEKLMAQDCWILDGNYMGTLDLRISRADTIIHLDMSTLTCLWGILRRRYSAAGRSRPDLGSGNPDRLERDFVWYVLRFRSQKRQALLQRLGDLPDSVRLITHTSRRDAYKWLNQLSRQDIPQESK